MGFQIFQTTFLKCVIAHKTCLICKIMSDLLIHIFDIIKMIKVFYWDIWDIGVTVGQWSHLLNGEFWIQFQHTVCWYDVWRPGCLTIYLLMCKFCTFVSVAVQKWVQFKSTLAGRSVAMTTDVLFEFSSLHIESIFLLKCTMAEHACSVLC